MKRFLSFLLIAATLLSLLPVMSVSASENSSLLNDDGGESASHHYTELYVKEGLAALFVAYESTASESAVTAWTPAPLYGKAGYDSYIDPSLYTTQTVSGGKLVWQQANGSFKTALTAANTDENPGTYLKLTALHALLSDNFAVQEVWQQTSSTITGNTPVYTENEDGTVTAAALGGGSFNEEQATNSYGFLSLKNNYVPGFQSSNGDRHNHFYYQVTPKNASYANATARNIVFENASYLLDTAKKSFTNNTSKTYNVGSFPMAVMEQTVSRRDFTELEDGFSAYYQFSWQFKPAKYYGKNATSRHYGFTTYSTTDTDNLIILRDKVLNVYSVRVYEEKVLTDAEMDQNHLADLCGFYGIDVDILFDLDAEGLAGIASALASTPLVREKYNADGSYTDTFLRSKAKVESVIASAVASFATAEEHSYTELYVKEGLAALFVAYEATASEETPTTWAPVNLYGQAGYDAYVDPASYASVLKSVSTFAWKWKTGALTSSAVGTNTSTTPGTYISLKPLMELIGDNWSVQEVWQWTGSTKTGNMPEYTVNEDGTVTVSNASSLSQEYASNNVYGFLNIRRYYVPNFITANGSRHNHFFYQIYQPKNSSFSNATSRNIVFDNANYLESTATKTFTNSTTKYFVGSMPTAVVEQTLNRTNFTEVEGGFSARYDFIWQFKPSKYYGSNASSRTYGLTTYYTTNAKNMTLCRDKTQNVYSLRVYDGKALTDDEVNLNHFADLCGFYGIDVSPLWQLDATARDTFAKSYATVAMVRERFEADGETETLNYLNAKLSLQNAINELAMEEIMSGQTAKKSLLSFDGYSVRVSGDYGMRAIFTLDKASVEVLAELGTEVLAFGAVTAIGNYDGTVYNEDASALTVSVAEDGTVSLAEGVKGAALTVSNAEGFRTVSDTDEAVRFAYTTLYSSTDLSAASLYNIALLYRGFAVLKNAAGVTDVVYYESTRSEALSLFSLHDEIVNDHGHYLTRFPISSFDYIYDMLSAVSPAVYTASAREEDRTLCESYGFDETSIRLSFSALSDTHCIYSTPAIGNKVANQMKKISSMYELDAFLFCGDLGDNMSTFTNAHSGTKDSRAANLWTELAHFGEYAAKGNADAQLPIIWNLGNHDAPDYASGSEITVTAPLSKNTYTFAAGTTTYEAAVEIFGASSSLFFSEDTLPDGTSTIPYEGFRYNNINGYSFFSVDYRMVTEEALAWLDNQLALLHNADPSKPIFFNFHVNSTSSATKYATGQELIKETIGKYNQVIWISGHAHIAMQRQSSMQIRDGFAEINIGPNRLTTNVNSTATQQFMNYQIKHGAVIQVDANGNIRVLTVDYSYQLTEDGTVEGTDRTDRFTVIDNPMVIRTTYFAAPAVGKAQEIYFDTTVGSMDDPRYVTPHFGADAAASFSNITAGQATVTFSTPTVANVITYYTATVKNVTTGETVKIYDRYRLSDSNSDNDLCTAYNFSSDYMYYGPAWNYPAEHSFILRLDESALVEGNEYSVSIYGRDDFGQLTDTVTFALPAAMTTPAAAE